MRCVHFTANFQSALVWIGGGCGWLDFSLWLSEFIICKNGSRSDFEYESFAAWKFAGASRPLYWPFHCHGSHCKCCVVQLYLWTVMHLFRFRKLGLTLALSIVMEVLCFLVVFCLDENLPTWLIQTFKRFHYSAYFLIFSWLNPDSGETWQIVLWSLFMISAAVCQWWLIILASMWVFRHFKRGSTRFYIRRQTSRRG